MSNNSTIKSMINHRSVRSYKNQPMPVQDIDAIIEATNKAPTSINGQVLSNSQDLAAISGKTELYAFMTTFLCTIFFSFLYNRLCSARRYIHWYA